MSKKLQDLPRRLQKIAARVEKKADLEGTEDEDLVWKLVDFLESKLEGVRKEKDEKRILDQWAEKLRAKYAGNEKALQVLELALQQMAEMSHAVKEETRVWN